MKFTQQQAVIDAPIDQVDLEKWLFTLSDSEYQAAAHGHRAAGTFTEDGVRGTINVESIGGTLMVQHYHEVSAEPTRVEMLSKRTRAYVFHLIPRFLPGALDDDGLLGELHDVSCVGVRN